MAINDVFSKRGKPLPDVYQHDDLPERLRVQLQQILDESLSPIREVVDVFGNVKFIAFAAIRKAAMREDGLHFLASSHLNERLDVLQCVETSENVPLVLNIVELGCKLLSYRADASRTRFHLDPEHVAKVIEEINYRFLENGVGFQFEPTASRLISMNNQLVHQTAIQPALQLLADPRFKTANDEFVEGFDDYRKADYDDCLTKCCSAFESVMKIVCKIKGWPYADNETANQLIKTQLAKNGLDSFFETPLILIATLRNRLSKSHGAGTQAKIVPEHLARYALNVTASAILLIVDAAQLPR